MWTLINTVTKKPALPGDCIQDFRGEYARLGDPVGRPPHHEGSTGRVWVDSEEHFGREFFPSVFKLKWQWSIDH